MSAARRVLVTGASGSPAVTRSAARRISCTSPGTRSWTDTGQALADGAPLGPATFYGACKDATRHVVERLGDEVAQPQLRLQPVLDRRRVPGDLAGHELQPAARGVVHDAPADARGEYAAAGLDVVDPRPRVGGRDLEDLAGLHR